MKQQDLADILGLKSYEMSFIENKIELPDKDLLVNLATALHVTVGQIYTKEELDLILSRKEN